MYQNNSKVFNRQVQQSGSKQITTLPTKKVRNAFNCIADFFNIRLNTLIMPFISPNT